MNITDHMAGMAAHGMPKTPKAPQMSEGGEHEGGAKEAIHAHLKAMQEKHGGAHTHIHHHEDGSHESHHVTEDGQVSGPHEHDGAGCAVEGGSGATDSDGDNDSEGLM